MKGRTTHAPQNQIIPHRSKKAKCLDVPREDPHGKKYHSLKLEPLAFSSTAEQAEEKGDLIPILPGPRRALPCLPIFRLNPILSQYASVVD